MTAPRTTAGPATAAGQLLVATHFWSRADVLAIEAEAVAQALAALRAEVEGIEHPCHDVCVGSLHADCQCAAWIRQEALAAIDRAAKP